jgi:hypothetical protein
VLVWLLNQDEYELDLNYATPAGLTAASLIIQIEDLSPRLFEALLRKEIALDAPCARMWSCQLGFPFLQLKSKDLIESLGEISLTQNRPFNDRVRGLDLVRQASELF